MKRFDFNEFKILMEQTGGTHISIYMPTHVGGGLNPQDLIRYKNLLQNAEEKLISLGLRSPDIRKILRPAEALQQDNLFWRQQYGGLALFLAEDFFNYYRLPLPLNELLVVTERFHLKPLITLLSSSGVFYVQALSQNKVRVLECTAYSSEEVTPKGIPGIIDEFNASGKPAKQVLRYGVKSASGGGDTTLFKGPGISPESQKQNLLNFLRKVDAEISALLKQETAPLILASVDYLQSLYRSVNTYAQLLPEGIAGNPDEVDDENLRVKAWELAEPYFQRAEQEAAAQYHQYEGTGLTSTETGEVIEAAYTGRIKFLFIARGIQKWGKYDAASHQIELHEHALPGDQDLLDLAAYYTLQNSGTIFLKDPPEMPGGESIAAVLRY